MYKNFSTISTKILGAKKWIQSKSWSSKHGTCGFFKCISLTTCFQTGFFKTVVSVGFGHTYLYIHRFGSWNSDIDMSPEWIFNEQLLLNYLQPLIVSRSSCSKKKSFSKM